MPADRTGGDPGSGEPWLADPVLDAGILSGLRQLSELSGTDLLSSVVDIFRRESASSMAALERAQQEPAGDPGRDAEPREEQAADLTCQALHRLRGSAGNIGARRVARSCAELERAAEAGVRVGTARLDELARLLDEALTALDRAALNPDATTTTPTPITSDRTTPHELTAAPTTEH